MNWADSLNADSDAIIFSYTDPTLWLLNAGGPLQFYFLFMYKIKSSFSKKILSVQNLPVVVLSYYDSDFQW